MEEVTLTDGTVVRCIAASPLAVRDVVRSLVSRSAPEMPEEVVESIAGGTERHPAREGTEAFNRWAEEMRLVEQEENQLWPLGMLLAGIIDWKLPGQRKFSERVPGDWEFPRPLVRAGKKPREGEVGRVYDFIAYGLVRTTEDQRRIHQVVMGTSANPLTVEEVEAQEKSFPGHEG